MRDDDQQDDQEKKPTGLSRRSFLKASGISLSVPLVMGTRVLKVDGAEVKIYGPAKVPVGFTVDGKRQSAEVEPRVTLLETLRHEMDCTAPKRVCDRASCGACT